MSGVILYHFRFGWPKRSSSLLGPGDCDQYGKQPERETDKPAAHARLAPPSDEDGIGCVCDLLAAVTDGIER